MHTQLVSSTHASLRAHLSGPSSATMSSQLSERWRIMCATSLWQSPSCVLRRTRLKKDLTRAGLASVISPTSESLITVVSWKETELRSHSFSSSRETRQAGFVMSKFRERTTSWKSVARTKQTYTINCSKKKSSQLSRI